MPSKTGTEPKEDDDSHLELPEIDFDQVAIGKNPYADRLIAAGRVEVTLRKQAIREIALGSKSP